jgi:chorismate dehydratase
LIKDFKIGRINYLNLFPIFYGLERTARGYSFIGGHPSAVNRMLREGLVDASPSSSIEYLRRPGEYELVRGHSISSRRLIKSILFFSAREIEETSGNVYVTVNSETSVAMLEIILKLFLKRDVRLLRTGEPLCKVLPGKNSFLSIGDEALVAGRGTRLGRDFSFLDISGKKYFVYDLGKLWHRHTGLSFVYALWIARKKAVFKNAVCPPEDRSGLGPALCLPTPGGRLRKGPPGAAHYRADNLLLADNQLRPGAERERRAGAVPEVRR